MADSDAAGITLHEDVPLFREAIAFTAAATGFNGQVIEKDYFCTVVLADLSRHGGANLIFKGGTCLAKVHAGFYRLSEDLDFAISMPVDASRSERSEATATLKQVVAAISQRMPGFSCDAELKGANDSSQYNGIVSYRSVLSGEREPIFIDVSVREPVLTPPSVLNARTALMDPVSGKAAVPEIAVLCVSLLEAFAEKFRAALSRRDVAIRDFYDLDYAVRHLSLNPRSPSFVEIVRQKLAVPNNPPVDVGSTRMASLRRQLEAKLKTVLREKEFRDFAFERAIALVADMASRIA